MYTSIVCDIKNSISIHNSHMKVEEAKKSHTLYKISFSASSLLEFKLENT